MNDSNAQTTFDFMPQPKWWHRSVSWLLWLANSDAPQWGEYRFAFYRLKDGILSAEGLDVGADWQRIRKSCWSCNGTGTYTHYSGNQDCCYRCYGSGVFSTYYVKLHRYRFGGRIFHRPGESQSCPPDVASDAIIDGRIRHGRKGWKAVAAFVVLLVLFDRRCLVRLSKGLARKARSRVRRAFAGWLPRRCCQCQKLMIRRKAAAIVHSYGKTGILCKQCAEEVPF